MRLLQTATVTKTRIITHRFCQHRWPAIAGMVGFRNNVGNAPLTGWVSPSSQQIAFARGTYQRLCCKGRAHVQGTGSLGFVAINNADNAWSATFSTGLPRGWYCNVFDGMPYMGTCSGTSYVEDASCCRRLANYPFFVRRFWIEPYGYLTVTVGPRQAIAVHTGARGVETPKPKTLQQVSVLFSENATTTFGEVSTASSFAAWSEGALNVILESRDRTFLWWAACRNLVTGTRPTRCVRDRIRRR